MSTSFFRDTVFDTGRTSLPYHNVLQCYAQKWTLIEYSMLDARLKKIILDLYFISIHANLYS